MVRGVIVNMLGAAGSVLFAVLCFLGAVLAATASKILADEIRDHSIAISEWLIVQAVRPLPEPLRDRLYEEWRGQVAEAPGRILKIYVAMQCVRASLAIRARERRAVLARNIAWLIKCLYVSCQVVTRVAAKAAMILGLIAVVCVGAVCCLIIFSMFWASFVRVANQFVIVFLPLLLFLQLLSFLAWIVRIVEWLQKPPHDRRWKELVLSSH